MRQALCPVGDLSRAIADGADNGLSAKPADLPIEQPTRLNWS